MKIPIIITILASAVIAQAHTFETFSANFVTSPTVSAERKDRINVILYRSALPNYFLSVYVNQYDQDNGGLDFQIEWIKNRYPNGSVSVSNRSVSPDGLGFADIAIKEGKYVSVIRLIVPNKRVDYRVAVDVNIEQVADANQATRICSQFIESFRFLPTDLITGLATTN